MSKKFTEEQYQQIIEEWDNATSYTKGTKAVIDYLEYKDLGCIADEALALANLATREWAHDKFVEKEKRYIWQSKQETDSGDVKRLYNAAIGIADSFVEKTKPIHNGNLITETEVKKWGYDPEMFDKEEV